MSKNRKIESLSEKYIILREIHFISGCCVSISTLLIYLWFSDNAGSWSCYVGFALLLVSVLIFLISSVARLFMYRKIKKQ